MDLELLDIAGIIGLIVIIALFFAIKVKKPEHDALERSVSSSDPRVSEMALHLQKELKGIKRRIDDMQFAQRRLDDRISSLQMARGIENEQVKYLTQNIHHTSGG
jgi:predicted transcriptional regulator